MGKERKKRTTDLKVESWKFGENLKRSFVESFLWSFSELLGSKTLFTQEI
jgi:hypothetical protein